MIHQRAARSDGHLKGKTKITSGNTHWRRRVLLFWYWCPYITNLVPREEKAWCLRGTSKCITTCFPHEKRAVVYRYWKCSLYCNFPFIELLCILGFTSTYFNGICIVYFLFVASIYTLRALLDWKPKIHKRLILTLEIWTPFQKPKRGYPMLERN